ncbi:MAG: 3'-5' exonuclease [Candidatus Hodarchaeales archaeon]|jgi:hypothetical protein
MAIIGYLGKNYMPGEKKLYGYLSRIQDVYTDTFCYYEPLIQDKYPDFLLIGARIGVVVIEIKDYKEEALISVSPSEEWITQQNGQTINVPNPLNQVYNYWKGITRKIDVSITDMEFNNIVQQVIVLPNITKESKIGTEIQEYRPSRIKIFFKEEIQTKYANFQQIFNKKINHTLELSRKQVQLLRANLVPSSRLPSKTQIPLGKYFTPEEELKLLDQQQERLARELGEGHRLIFGVAGSGKTILLLARARYLALKHTNWKILLLCFNINLREHLKKLLNPADYEAQVEVDNFHHWAKDMIMAIGGPYKIAYQEAAENIQTQKKKDTFFKTVVSEILLDAITNTKIRPYDAILIDEGQDFEKEWFTPVIQLLNPKTNSLLIAVDGLQSVYKRKKFFWKEVGVQAVGRVRRFTKSYRNPKTIGQFAYSFLLKDPNISTLIQTQDDHLATDGFIREGGEVTYRNVKTQEEEYKIIIEYINKFKEKKYTTLLLFFRNPKNIPTINELLDLLKKEQLEWSYLDKGLKTTPGINIGTIHGTKGLEADAIIIPHISLLQKMGVKRKLIYVGMTRAIHYLLLTSSWENEWTRDIKELLGDRK